ncbi:hypothetical protein [Chitinophaga sp. RAB17]|uniref:hypothetical protein n=1 Tax=Chitinophaga sp. RAB17 TaxID=3233049 RepID=UPI003F908EDC
MKLNFFKRSSPVAPDFAALKKSPIKDHYFYRAPQWYWLNSDLITVIDSHGPRMITMDPWLQMIFLDATGKLTITEYVDFIADKYKKEIPADLNTIILSMTDLLLKDKVICLSLVPREPDLEHNRPLSFK